MNEEPEAKRGNAAWKEQREAVALRNADAHKRGQAERRERERAINAQERVSAAREAAELDELNASIVKRQAGGTG